MGSYTLTSCFQPILAEPLGDLGQPRVDSSGYEYGWLHIPVGMRESEVVRHRLLALGVITGQEKTREEIIAAGKRFMEKAYHNENMLARAAEAIQRLTEARYEKELENKLRSKTSVTTSNQVSSSSPLTKVTGLPSWSGQSTWINPLYK